MGWRKRWRNLPLWRRGFACLLGVCWLLWSLGLVLFHLDESALRNSGTPAKAEVIAINQGGRGPDYAVISFVTADGREIQTEVEVTVAASFPDEGVQIGVRYDPSSPAENVVVAEVHSGLYWLDRLVWSIVLIGFSGVLVGAVAGGFEKRKRR